MQNTPATETPKIVESHLTDDLTRTKSAKSHPRNLSAKRPPWYKSQSISSMSCSFFFMLWFTSGSYVLGQLNTVPTRVILKKEGCTYMHHQKVSSKPYDDVDQMCVVSAPFHENLIGNGGVFKLEDRELNVADNQIVAVEKLDNIPYSDSQKRMLMWLCINTLLVIATLAWTIFSLL